MRRGKPAGAPMVAGAIPAEEGSGAQAADNDGGDDEANFVKTLERTRQALLALAAHWREVKRSLDPGCEDKGLASVVAEAAADPGELTREGHAWSQKAGLAFILPSKALLCEPTAQSTGRDGLRASTAGGHAMATHPGLIVAPAPPCGFGVFATMALQKGENLGEYTGEVRRYDVWCEEIKARKRAARGRDESVPFIREELYAAWAGDGPTGAGVVVDAFSVGNAMRFINCSCSPNCTFKSFGQGAEKHNRLKVIALRKIAPWEQLSVDYGWYFDDATLQDVRDQAVEAYHRDLPAFSSLKGVLPCSGNGTVNAFSDHSEAVHVLVEALYEARGPPLPPRSAPPSFLRRFVDGDDVARFFEQGGCLSRVGSFKEIADVVWPLYEVVGADLVGIPCRCALDPSLNAQGRCSGIIGRPLQAWCSGRDDVFPIA